MCTVSFIPTRNHLFITTNRDEYISRKLATPPQHHHSRNKTLLHPTDGNAGGTWVTVCNKGNVGVLLNGAWNNHQRKESYKKSRGIVLLQIMAWDNPVEAFKKYDFDQIEPFTLVIWKNGSLYTCRWDEQEAFVHLSNSLVPCLWSSSTLYKAEVQAKRWKHFSHWFSKHSVPTTEDIIRFHESARYENEELPSPDHNPQIKTVSITSIQISRQTASVTYCDLLQNNIYKTAMPMNERLRIYEVV